MTRKYTDYVGNGQEIKKLLKKLSNKSTPPEEYKEACYHLGEHFGRILTEKYKNLDTDLYIACTVEDADFLAKGIIDSAKSLGKFQDIKLACFWNERVNFFNLPETSSAPIKKRYREPFSKERKQLLVVVKSIISSSCVIRTNLTNLMEEMTPTKIAIVAPVMLNTAEENLKSEFETAITEKFEYFSYAIDDAKDIEGNVYLRLGWNSQEEKNKNIPNIIKERRQYNSSLLHEAV